MLTVDDIASTPIAHRSQSTTFSRGSCRLMATTGWKQKFDEPINLPNGRHKPVEFDQTRKAHHWGRRKLKRDE